MIRKFTLINNAGVEQSLDSDDVVFSSAPSGLGFSKYSEIHFSGGLPVVDSVSFNQTQAAITLVFGADKKTAYSNYYNFVNFLTPKMILRYETDAGSFLRDCIVSSLTKSEIGEFNTLIEDITLDFTSPWYKNFSQIAASTNTTIFCNSSMEYIYSPLKISIAATMQVINPNWTLYNNGGSGTSLKQDQNDRYYFNLQSGQTFTVNSDPRDQYARIYTNSTTYSDAIQYIDVTRTNFCMLRRGQNRLYLPQYGSGTITISWIELYGAV